MNNKNKPLLCQLGFHKTNYTKGINRVVICSRCKSIVREHHFPEEIILFAAVATILLLLIYIILTIKGVI